MSPQLSANLVLDLTTDVQGSNAVIYAPGIRDVLFFAYLGAAGHTFDELGEVLSLQSSVPGESIRVELPSPGVPNRILWIQEDYPLGILTMANLQQNMPTAVHGFDFGLSSKTRLMFSSSHDLQLEWREAPSQTSISPGYFLEYLNKEERYEVKGLRYISLLGRYLYHREDFKYSALGIPVEGGLTLFVIVPSRKRPDGVWTFGDSDHLKTFLERLDLNKLSEIRSKMTQTLVEGRLPLLSAWESNDSPEIPVYLGESSDFSMLYPLEGVYVEKIEQSSSILLSESGLSLSSVTSLSMHLPTPPPGSGDYGSYMENVQIPVGFSLAPQPLPIEFAADQPHVMILADDFLTQIQSVVVVRTIPLADQLSPEEVQKMKPSAWIDSSWFGWLFTDQMLEALRPWYYHATHGWIYLPENIQASGTWWWDGALGWSFASATSPYIYSLNHGWLWHASGSAGERVFYSYRAGDWVFE